MSTYQRTMAAVLYVAIGAVAWAAPQQGAAARDLDMEDAAQRIAAEGPQTKQAISELKIARAQARAQRGRLLPSLHLAIQPIWFRTDFVFSLQGKSYALKDGASNLVSVSIAQPLLGLLHLSHDYGAALHHAAAAQHHVGAKRATVLADTRESFLRLLMARALKETAQASVTDLRAEVAEAASKAAIGTLTQADVLRIQVAAHHAEQEVIDAQTQEIALEASIKEQLGVAADDPSIALVHRLVEQEAESSGQQVPVHQARTHALRSRPEIRAARQEQRAAALTARAKALALLPDISVAASYMRADNSLNMGGATPLYSDGNVGYVGLKLDWAVWEWGAAYYAQQAAHAERQRADAALTQTAQSIATEVAVRSAEHTARQHAVEVAKLAVASSEEAYRVMGALIAAGEATTTDLLDSQAALTRSRSELVRARHEAAIAHVQLERALGPNESWREGRDQRLHAAEQARLETEADDSDSPRDAREPGFAVKHTGREQAPSDEEDDAL